MACWFYSHPRVGEAGQGDGQHCVNIQPTGAATAMPMAEILDPGLQSPVQLAFRALKPAPTARSTTQLKMKPRVVMSMALSSSPADTQMNRFQCARSSPEPSSSSRKPPVGAWATHNTPHTSKGGRNHPW